MIRVRRRRATLYSTSTISIPVLRHHLIIRQNWWQGRDIITFAVIIPEGCLLEFHPDCAVHLADLLLHGHEQALGLQVGDGVAGTFQVVGQ